MRSRSASGWYALTFSRMSLRRIICSLILVLPLFDALRNRGIRWSCPQLTLPARTRRLARRIGDSTTMITCPACGKENEDSAFECKRCRAPLREDHEHHEHHEEHHAAPAEEAPPAEEAAPAEPAEPQASSELGTVCRRCEAFNEPGVRNCTACGYDLFAGALQEAVASGEQQS